ncbi:hypothetical protein GQ43DRAFT_434040 [Delitschia confertaspora ATCC 74209]|uniref:Uncharacterized protein n=1 Tax=Delitschia confertaspora ATCC 74209 TaxID=1513339 RepID=A0A9P4JLL7_9PLEO|nr:hypothetical protein GQ43DRAFT_434040 [Delitschia confertaspora ATCC 74209]
MSFRSQFHGDNNEQLLIEGVAIGCVFQPEEWIRVQYPSPLPTTVLVTAQGHTSKADATVVTSAQNLTRSLGGAVGLTNSSAIFRILSNRIYPLVSPLVTDRGSREMKYKVENNTTKSDAEMDPNGCSFH